MTEQTDNEALVEELAREITPLAFVQWQNMVEHCIAQGDSRQGAIMYANSTYGPSIRKAKDVARAILPIITRRDAETWNRAIEAAEKKCLKLGFAHTAKTIASLKDKQ